MMYYLGLMVGRFVYFDASFRDFLQAMKNMFLNLPMLLMGLTLAGLLSFMGFSMEFLLERNYYIVGVFYTHLFLLAAVFVIHICQLIYFRIRRR
jgi:ABC-type sulfate transport system permease component